jgi:ribosomal 30S subunit maturation factor RimM
MLWAFGFKANKDKTRYRNNTTRLKVCGIVVNTKISIQRSEIKRFRAKVHHAIVKFPDHTTKTRLRELKGWASFLMSADEQKGKYYMNQLTAFEQTKFPTLQES